MFSYPLQAIFFLSILLIQQTELSIGVIYNPAQYIFSLLNFIRYISLECLPLMLLLNSTSLKQIILNKDRDRQLKILTLGSWHSVKGVASLTAPHCGKGQKSTTRWQMNDWHLFLSLCVWSRITNVLPDIARHCCWSAHYPSTKSGEVTAAGYGGHKLLSYRWLGGSLCIFWKVMIVNFPTSMSLYWLWYIY